MVCQLREYIWSWLQCCWSPITHQLKAAWLACPMHYNGSMEHEDGSETTKYIFYPCLNTKFLWPSNHCQHGIGVKGQNMRARRKVLSLVYVKVGTSGHWVRTRIEAGVTATLKVWLSFFGCSPCLHGHRKQHTGKVKSSRPRLQPTWYSGQAAVG